jgi:hypothetical protein
MQYVASHLVRLLVIAFSVATLITTKVVAENSKRSPNWTLPRTAEGYPDLQGVWTNATITPLERPNEFGSRLTMTDAEAAALEKRQARGVEASARPSDLSKDLPPAGDGVGGYNNFWIDRGSKVVALNGQKRTSLIIDPPNGKAPPLLAARRQEMAGRMQRMRANFDGPEARPLGERCLLAFGSSSGPPMLPVLYNNHYQIVQNKDSVMIQVEMVHDVRVVRMNSAHLPNTIRKWMGDSVGHWDGDTLVVETTNFTDKEGFRGATENRKIIERFTRVGSDTMNYRVTIDDPAAFTQPWTAEYPFYLTNEMMYEYACHEGNYALPGILAGAREQEKAARQSR